MELNGEILEGMKSIKYLDTTVVLNGGVKIDMSKRMNESYKLLCCMKRITRKKKEMSMKVKRVNIRENYSFNK